MTDDTNDNDLFTEAVKGIRKLKQTRVVHEPPKPKPVPRPRERTDHKVLADSFSDHFIPAHELESGDEVAYLRAGHSPDILRKLKRGHWDIQGQLDLHGMLADEARLYVAEFLIQSKNRGARCIRIIHGKGLGSRNGEPVLKNRLRSWLVQQPEVIAYCQAREEDGGGGALVVLLSARSI
jgi:DNA-nicking Smr family endonuclease